MKIYQKSVHPSFLNQTNAWSKSWPTSKSWLNWTSCSMCWSRFAIRSGSWFWALFWSRRR